jgi:hypothetical protein
MTVATPPPPEPAPARAVQRLSATDRVLLAVDRTVRGLGGPGFETQTLLWLGGRVAVAGLRTGLERFSARHPIACARLEGEGSSGSCWRFRPGGRCPLEEAWLGSAEEAAVLDHAAGLLSTPVALGDSDPIRFHLLHRPDGRDVLLLQYNHALMDNNAAVPLLVQLDRLSDPGAAGEEGRRDERRGLVPEHLRRFDRERRRRALRDCVRLWGRGLRGGVVQLGRPCPPGSGPPRLRFALRSLEQPAARALWERLLRAGGLPNLSMALLGSAFRAIARLAPAPAPAAHLAAGIGVDLGLRRRAGPLFGNPVSLVPIRANQGDLGDRDGLAALLARQFRERLQDALDVGMLQLMPVLCRRPSETRWLLGLGLRQGCSLWYAYFGSLDGVGDRFCGAAVEDVFFTGPTWPPMGLTLLISQFRGRLRFLATYFPESVPEPLAGAFLDQLLADLIQEVG